MINLRDDTLLFSFPDVHPQAKLHIEFQRTLRIPDDHKNHFLPPGLGCFPVRLVDEYLAGVPAPWVDHGGVMLPMYQSEALWINFSSVGERYPFAVKIAAGKINAVTGDPWSDGIHRDPQDYMIAPHQPWLDGFAVEKGVIRQFVAMPLGSGYSAEEQLTGKAEFGGLQVIAYPMKREVWEKRQRERERESNMLFRMVEEDLPTVTSSSLDFGIIAADMSLAPGGKMRQEIFDDPFRLDDWDLEHSARCFVHLTNSMIWHQITGEHPPTVPLTAKEYSDAGLPWFDFYDEKATALPGSEKLEGLKSVREMGEEKGEMPLPENQSVTVSKVHEIRRGMERDQVREGRV